MSENVEKRPMPGPPECTCIGRGSGCLTCLDAIGYDLEAICPGCHVHAGPSYRETKRLTDAECAAECWRVDADYQTEWLAELSMRLRNLQRVEVDDLPPEPLTVGETRAQARRYWSTWHRFATHPHALEVHE